MVLSTESDWITVFSHIRAPQSSFSLLTFSQYCNLKMAHGILETNDIQAQESHNEKFRVSGVENKLMMCVRDEDYTLYILTLLRINTINALSKKIFRGSLSSDHLVKRFKPSHIV